MKRENVFRGFALVFAVVAALATSGVCFAETTLSVGSGTSGGAFYMVGAALAQIIQKYAPDVNANSEATGGTSENLRLVADKRTDIGMGMADDVVAAYKGERGFSKKAAPELRVLMSGQTNTFHIMTLAKSDIKTLADIKGKRVSLGPSGAPFFGPDLLEKVAGYKRGQDYKGQYLGHDQAAEALANGDVDLVIATLAYPAGAYSNLVMTHDVRFIELTDADMAVIQKEFPFWKDVVIPKGTYKNDADIRTAAVPVWLFVHQDADEQAIYEVTKAILEHSDELATIHPDAGKYRLETATEGVNLPFHPGAEKYYKEKGVLQ